MASRRRPKGEGSIHRVRGRGGKLLYRAQSPPIGYKPNGVAIRKSFVRENRTEAASALRDWMATSAALGERDPHKLKVSVWAAQWIADEIKPGRAYSTHRKYRQSLEAYVLPVIGSYTLARCTEAHCRSVLSRMQAKGRSASTMGIAYAVMSGMFRAAVEARILVHSPIGALRCPKREPSDPVYLSEQSAYALLARARNHRLWGLFAMWVGTGVRHGESLGMEWSRLNTERGTYRLVRQLQREDGEYRLVKLKSKARRTLKLPPFTLRALEERRAAQAQERLASGGLFQNPLGLIFTSEIGTPLNQSTTLREFRKLADECGIPREVHIHSLRHTVGTILAGRGKQESTIQELLGHASSQMTRHYTHVTETMAKDAALELDRIFGTL